MGAGVLRPGCTTRLAARAASLSRSLPRPDGEPPAVTASFPVGLEASALSSMLSPASAASPKVSLLRRALDAISSAGTARQLSGHFHQIGLAWAALRCLY